jgi:competence protein ComEA
MELTKTHKLVLIVCTLSLFAGFSIFDHYNQKKNVYLLAQSNAAGEHTVIQPEANSLHNNTQINPPPATIMVHIEGQVAKPGVYTLPEGTRLVDLVETAGGLTGEAAVKINLAQRLNDEAFIYIPAEGEAASADPFNSGFIQTSGSASQNGLVNINTADQRQLESLPGIGPVLAERIIEYRSQHGPFKNVQELKNVSGIGDVKFRDLESTITSN